MAAARFLTLHSPLFQSPINDEPFTGASRPRATGPCG